MNENEKAREKPPAERIRFSSVISFLFLSLVAIIIAYILGVMAGRSGNEQNPYAEKPAADSAAEKGPVQNSPPAEAILRPQDLDYALVLRNEKARTRPVDSESPQAGPEPAKAPLTEETPKKEAGPVAEEGSGEAEAQELPMKSEAAQSPDGQGELFDYVFQLGAFRDEDSVDALRQKLEGRGLRTRMRKDGKLYLVLVLLRGNQERAAEVMEIAKSLRLGEPLVRSRKPAAQ